MFGRVWSFVKRHRKKFIFAGVVVGGAVLLGRYARKKLLDYQANGTAECFAYARRQHHFDSNQRTCNTTALSMLPTLREALCHKLDSEHLTSQLRAKPSNKLEIWEELKIISFTRTTVAVYSCCMLVVFLRVQLNILGGYIYRDSLINGSSSSESVVATETIRKQYLSGIEYLFEQGLSDLIADVEAAMRSTLSQYNLKDQMSLLTIRDVIDLTRQRIEYRHSAGEGAASWSVGGRAGKECRDGCAPAGGGQCGTGWAEEGCDRMSSLCRYMIAPEQGLGQASYVTREERILNRLNCETRDMIESADFHTVVTMCLDTGFSHLVDRVAEYFRSPVGTEPACDSAGSTVMMPVAKVIPIVNGLVYSLVADAPNPFLKELLLKDQMKHFAANVYDAFCESRDERCTIK